MRQPGPTSWGSLGTVIPVHQEHRTVSFAYYRVGTAAEHCPRWPLQRMCTHDNQVGGARFGHFGYFVRHLARHMCLTLGRKPLVLEATRKSCDVARGGRQHLLVPGGVDTLY